MPAPSRKRILIVAVNWLGDLLFMTPAIRAIRRAYPESHLACLVAARGVELLAGNPHLNAVIPLEESRGFANLANWWPMIRRLRQERFDTAFLFHRSFSRTAIVWLAGIRSRIGVRTWKRSWLLTEGVDPVPKDSVHKVDWFLRVLSAVGIEPDGRHYEAGILPEDEAAARRILDRLGVGPQERLVALHAGANWNLKRWPAKNFARLADRLNERFKARVLFVGGPGDRPLVERIVGGMRTKPLVTTGETTFRQLGSLLKETQLLISNDSGPLHMGHAVGTPVIGLFGPTDPNLTGPPKGVSTSPPKGVSTSLPTAVSKVPPKTLTLFGSIGCPVPCYWLQCPKNLCLHEITVEQVLEAAGQVMELKP